MHTVRALLTPHDSLSCLPCPGAGQFLLDVWSALSGQPLRNVFARVAEPLGTTQLRQALQQQGQQLPLWHQQQLLRQEELRLKLQQQVLDAALQVLEVPFR